jgi:hypothetical protein
MRFIASGESFKSCLADLAPGEHGRSVQQLRLGGRDGEVELAAWRFDSAMLVVVHHLDGPPLPQVQPMPSSRQLALFA